MLLAKPTITQTKRGDYLVYCGTDATGRGVRKYRKSRSAADALAREFGARVREVGQAATELTSAQTFDAASAIRILQDAGVTRTLADVCREWLEARGGASSWSCEIGDAVVEYMKRFAPESEHAGSVRRALFALWGEDNRAPVMRVNRKMVESALSKYTNPKSYNLTRGYVLAFLHWASRNGKYPTALYAECLNIEKKRVAYVRPCTFDAATVERIMRAAEAQPDADMLVPRLALAFFAGIRTAETYRIRWGDIKFSSGDIRVESPKGVVGTPPRLVTMSANLKAWLLRYQMDDALPIGYDEEKFCKRKAEVVKSVGVEWNTVSNRNVARHTFASFHIAAHRDMSRTAGELGHVGGTAVLKAHYWGAVDADDAKAYWAIMPKGV